MNPDRRDDNQRVTCTACQLEVTGSEQRRIHYRSDLHLVNLKRKVGGLGPLTQSEFTRRVEVLQQNKLAAQAEGGGGGGGNDVDDKEDGNSSGRRNRRNREKTVCEICRKTFSSRQAFLNHEKSRRHIDMVNKQDTDMSEISSTTGGANSTLIGETEHKHVNGNGVLQNEEWTWAEDDEEDEMTVENELQRRLEGWDEVESVKRCPFDESHPISQKPLEALKDMAKCCGFFVPYVEYLSNPAGLIRYLSQKVCVGYACVACDKGFRSAEDARQHMRDVGHRRMTSNEEAFLEEYADFYTWTVRQKDDNDDDENGEWEEVNENEDEDVGNGNAVIVHPNAKQLIDATPIGRLNTRQDDDESQLEDQENVYALSLGPKTIGHRSLARYYKQAGGGSIDMRDSVVASRSAAEMRLAAWRADRTRMTIKQANGQSYLSRRHQCFELSVGRSNYYVRKSKLRMNMQVLNSGYRA